MGGKSIQVEKSLSTRRTGLVDRAQVMLYRFLSNNTLRAKLNTMIFLSFFSFIKCTGVEELPQGDADNGGLYLPGGFDAVVVVDSIGSARHLAVNSNGDIYVKLRNPVSGKGSVALRDTDNDGRADIVQYFGDYVDEGNYGTAMRIYNGYLYFSTIGEVYRTKLTAGKLIPEQKSELILKDDYKNDVHGFQHVAKPVTFDNKGNMYVPYGAPSDVCQVNDRKPGSPGQNPCPELEEHGGIWQFDANKIGQVQKDGKRYATGIRSVVAMDWNPVDNNLYVVQHGRDGFATPEHYSDWQNALLPSEEFLRINEGTDAGWPYYYYDFMQGKKLLNPEYGGDGKKEANGKEYAKPLIGFPGHFAPNDLFFYRGNQFPERYKHGAFIAFHGSTIRSPYPQAGYFISFVPFKNGSPSGPWEVFADGFAGTDTIFSTSDARYRPMGIAMGPDGSLYISESVKGKIWRIMFKGDKDNFGAAQLAEMEKRKEDRPNIRTPHELNDNLERGKIMKSAQLYDKYCASCHQSNGKGDGTRFPPLENSEWVRGDKQRLIDIVVNGIAGPITVNGVGYNGAMPANDFLKDEDIALILSYVRQNFKNNAGVILPAEVRKVREKKKKF